MPVSTTTARLLIRTLARPGTPTLRISAKRPHRRGTPRNGRATSERRERRWASSTRLPAPNDSARPQPAPAGPSAGSGPQPKISAGESRTCAATAPTMTAADGADDDGGGPAHVAGPAHDG